MEERRKRVNPETREAVAMSFLIVDRIHDILDEKSLKQKDLAARVEILCCIHGLVYLSCIACPSLLPFYSLPTSNIYEGISYAYALPMLRLSYKGT